MRWLKLAVIPLLLLLGSSTTRVASPNEDGFRECEHTVNKWASSALELEVKADKHVLQDLLFFLHVPRTGGRTYYHCFLKKLYPDFLECPRSYDKMRYDPSVMVKLPREKTSVVTILRDPVDRVFSAYEFSVEVAARFLAQPNLTSATRMMERLHQRTQGGGISTLNIWPWKYLVPWMIEDLFARKAARSHKILASMNSSDPYNMEDVMMPLHVYINDPLAQDIIHNGATFQIAGLTNNSYLAESHEVRQCVLKYQSLGQYVLDVAKRRLDAMLYIGLTQNHRESTTIFAHVVGSQVISQFIKSKFSKKFAAANLSEPSSSVLLSNSVANHDSSNTTNQDMRKFSTGNVNVVNENMTAEKLMDVYESCVMKLRTGMSQIRMESFANIYVNFTKEARRQVPRVLLQEIASLNQLDMELYKYARDIFAKQQKLMVPPMADADQGENRLSKSYAFPWAVFYVTSSGVLLPLFFFLLSRARRGALKMKL